MLSKKFRTYNWTKYILGMLNLQEKNNFNLFRFKWISWSSQIDYKVVTSWLLYQKFASSFAINLLKPKREPNMVIMIFMVYCSCKDIHKRLFTLHWRDLSYFVWKFVCFSTIKSARNAPWIGYKTYESFYKNNHGDIN